MTDVTCKTCPFSGYRVEGPCVCHHSSAKEQDPVRSPDWWCSEHPLAHGQRDRIAEMAMQGFLSDGGQAWARLMAEQVPLTAPLEMLVKAVYAVADAMMAERAKGKTHGLA
jgi:hypothetical protein